MPELSPVWAGFDSTTKTNWNNAGSFEGLTGWKEFLKDTAIRRANDGTGYSTPQTDRQCNVGRMTIESPASGFTIEQLHPNNYYVLKKVPKTKAQYIPQLITEHIVLPLTIGMSYRADLTPVESDILVGAGLFYAGFNMAGQEYGASGISRFYAEVYSDYQGRKLTTVLELPIDTDGNWHVETVEMTECFGVVRGYNLYIQVSNATGNLYFDNVIIDHSGHNWARDPHCNNINVTYTKAFYQIPKAWDSVDIPDGCFFDSFFYGMM